MSHKTANDTIVALMQKEPTGPTFKVPIRKAASVTTSEEIQKEIGSLVTEMKSMLGTDLVKQAKPV